MHLFISVDFDGTIVEHEYPDVGREVPGAIFWLKKFQEAGAKLILSTMRSDEALAEAVEFCRKNGIELYGVNNNPEQKSWTSSPKIYSHIHIDDTNACCPLRESAKMGGRSYVDWDVVGPAVFTRIIKG